FYSADDPKKILFYQTRAIYEEDAQDGRKYISKVDGDKTLFNIHKIDFDIPYIFGTEGPIDACFVKNGVGIVSTYLTEYQRDQITRNYPFHEFVFILDNQWLDKTAYERTKKILEEGKESIFIWPSKLKKYKDFNEYCVANKKNEF